jgi:hypothetical protein
MKTLLDKIKLLPTWAFLLLVAAILVSIVLIGALAYKLIFVPILVLIGAIGGRALGDVNVHPIPDPAAERLATAKANEIEAEKNIRLRALQMAKERRDRDRRDKERRERERVSRATDEALAEEAVEDAKKILDE